jgi:hypothetical protein
MGLLLKVGAPGRIRTYNQQIVDAVHVPALRILDLHGSKVEVLPALLLPSGTLGRRGRRALLGPGIEVERHGDVRAGAKSSSRTNTSAAKLLLLPEEHLRRGFGRCSCGSRTESVRSR